MKVENYKLNNLIQAVSKIKQTPWLPYSTIFSFAKVLQFWESALKPFFDTVKEIQKKHTIQVDGKPQRDDSVMMQDELEKISMESVEFPMADLEVTVKKGDAWLTLDIVKTFMDVFWDKFKINEL